MQTGFLISKHWQDTSSGIELTFWLKTDAGPVRLVAPDQEAVFFIRQIDQDEVEACVNQLPTRLQSAIRFKALDLKTFQCEAVTACYCRQQKIARQLQDRLLVRSIVFFESDVKPPERFLMERFATAAISFSTQQPLRIESSDPSSIRSLPAKHKSYLISSFKAADYTPSLSAISLDIETSYDGNDLYSIGIYSDTARIVWMVNPKPDQNSEESHPRPDFLHWVSNERQLIQTFIDWLEDDDPDLIIGWNVINFDLRFLEKKAKQLNMPLNLGRGKTPLRWFQNQNNAHRYSVHIPGRMALDGIDLIKTASYSFERYSLEFVSRELLGTGKKISNTSNRGAEIKNLFQTDKIALAEYNLEDCRLVLKIFDHLKLIDFATARSQLTGLDMGRPGGSVASFENLYFAKMHRMGYIAPNLFDKETTLNAPGGYVLDSRPGIYQNVLVLDFKSLYPSIIRTFLIDPVGMINGLEQSQSYADKNNNIGPVEGFNGAQFHRENHILPEIIYQLWQARDQAKKENNQSLSQAIKIIMNSFYGVLGSRGCRFFDPRLASSITMRGHWIIKTTKAWIEETGVEVIYGDTDSVFVLIDQALDPEQSMQLGNDLVKQLNQRWTEYLLQEFNLQSALELEFETLFTQFFMPALRGVELNGEKGKGSEIGSKKRYAGMKWIQDEKRAQIQFKGLENVRSDWTRLAKNVQHTLYLKVFLGEPYEDYLKEIIQDLNSGKLDEDLIYKKRLRQKVSEYTKSVPPHVKAAKLAAELTQQENSRKTKTFERGSWIEYLITVNGPEPVDMRRSAIDYDHYIEKQIAPVVDSILYFQNTTLDQITNPQGQLF